MSANLKHQVFSGVMWNTVARIGQQVIQFGLTVILARLLLPADFGAVGMISVFITFMAMFAEAGFASALVQRTDISQLHTNSVFWFNVVSGLVLSGVLFAAAPLVAAFYQEPILLPMTRGLSPVFVLSTAGLVPMALMQRRLQFHLLARINLIATFVSGVMGVILALLGAGVWSLVAMYLMSYLVVTTLNLVFGGWRPGRRFSLTALKELWSFTGNLLGYQFTSYWARSADNMLVGRFFGTEALGYYSRAYSLMLMPITQVIGVISSVLFAALSSIKEDRVRVGSIFLRATCLISFFSFPLMTGLFVVAEPFVLTVFGDKWSAMIPTLRILALVGALQSMESPTGWLYLSQGRTDWLFRWGLIRSAVLVGAIAVGIVLGSIETVALCYAGANLLLLYPDMVIPGKLVGIRFRDISRAVSGSFAGSAIMGLVVFGLGLLLPSALPDWQRLMILAAAGLLVFGSLAVALRHPAWLEIVILYRERLVRHTPSNTLPTSLD